MAKQTEVDVFLCDCGPIIKEVIDLDAVAAALEGEPGVAHVGRHGTLCSEEGQAYLTEAMKRHRGRRVVIAACTPREHELTFRRVAKRAGINPYLVSIANIREQCSWVHKEHRAVATQKALLLTRAAIARAREQRPLVEREIDANADAVVIGSGVAGLTTAKTLAAAGRKVHLVERDPVIGGRVARLSDVFPDLECASCMLEPLMDEVLHNDQIEVYTTSEVEEVLGYLGNFTVTIHQRARCVDVDACFGSQGCHAVCPVEVPNELEEGLTTRKAIYMPYAGGLPNVSVVDKDNCLHFKDGSCDACVSACPFGAIDLDAPDARHEVSVGAVVLATGAELKTADGSAYEHPGVFTSMALERMINSSGCTDGAIQLRDGSTPRSIALVGCADENACGPSRPCSKICCLAMTKYARLLREKLPDAALSTVQWERCVGGKGYRELSREVAAEVASETIQLGAGDTVALGPQTDRPTLVIRRGDETLERAVDMVVMAPPLYSVDAARALAEMLRLEDDGNGFLAEGHRRLRSFSSRVEGVFLAGTVQGPKDIEEAASHGAAAAGGVLSALVPGRKLVVDAARAEVDATRCGGCLTCPGLCPYKAITFDAERRVAEVNDLLCQGCGVCVAGCPSAAITARHFTDAQLEAEIDALVAG